MEAIELARWTRFAAKGGIGKCTALVDCVAENSDDLMFLKGDEIIVLMQLQEPPGVFLGSCEGVVGRFYGFNVHFHGKLKKPVMAKRSSVNSNSNTVAAGKSPTPTVTRTQVSIDERVATTLAALSPSPESLSNATKSTSSRLSSRPGSRTSAGQERSDGECTSSRNVSPAMPSMSSPLLKGTPPPSNAVSPPPLLVSYTYPKRPLRASIASSNHISVLSSCSQVTEDDEELSLANDSIDTVTHANSDKISDHFATSPPHLTTSVATTTTMSPKPMHPTLPTSFSSLSNSSLYASSSGSSVAPPAILSTASTITSPPIPLQNASNIPSTSTSAGFGHSRLSVDSDDGEVGIGLSLLQNLVDGDGWSGSDSDSELMRSRRKTSVRRKDSAQRRVSLRRRSAVRMSEDSAYSSEDGLNYADTETGHSLHSPTRINPTQQELDANISRTEAAFSQYLDNDDYDESPILGRHENRNTINQEMVLTFPPVAPLSPSPSRLDSSTLGEIEESYPSTYEFPAPPTHTHRISLSQTSTVSTSANSRPTSFVRPPRVPESIFNSSSTTRPSTAQSAQSSQSHTSSNWDGDIYDNYRYSRPSSSARSLSSRVSVNSRANGYSGSVSGSIVSTGVGEWPPENGGRPSFDGASSISGSASTASVRGSIDLQGVGHSQGQVQGRRTRSRSNTTASLNPVVLSPTIPQVAPAFVQTLSPLQLSSDRMPSHSPAPSIQQRSSPRLRQLEANRGSGLGHRPTDSESEGSVYSLRASARISGSSSAPPSARLDGSFSRSPLQSATFGTNMSQDLNSNTGARTSTTTTCPAPLNLISSNQTSPSAPLSPLSPTQQEHQRKNSTPSPLLHTHWGSAVSSPASAAQHATLPLVVPMTIDPTSSTASGSPPPGEREMPASFPRSLDAFGALDVPTSAQRESQIDERKVEVELEGEATEERFGRDVSAGGQDERQEKMYENHESEERDDDVVEDNTLVIGNGIVHESPSIASSPETEPDAMSKRRAASLVMANRTITVEDTEDDEDAEELEREKEKLRMEAASFDELATAPQDMAVPPPSGSLTLIAAEGTPPSTNSPVPAPSHLRPPKLSDIRPSGERQSLFLPHPNAPKATPTSLSPGPMYITSQMQPPTPQPNAQRVRGSAIQAIYMALSGHKPLSGPRGRGPTIYGITTVDLSAAMGPVPVQFAISPPPATAPPPGSVPPPSVPCPPATSTQPSMPVLVRSMPSTPSASAPGPGIAVRRVGSLDISSVGYGHTGTGVEPSEKRMVIPRANFFPQSGGIRPRSRSFSGFQSISVEVPLPHQHRYCFCLFLSSNFDMVLIYSQDAYDLPACIPSAGDVKRALSPNVGSPTTSTVSTKLGPRPSPLREVLPAPPRPSRPPNSPLAQSFAVPYTYQNTSSSLPSSPTTQSPPRLLRQAASRSTLNEVLLPRPETHISLTPDRVGDSPSPSAQRTPELRGRPSVEIDSVSQHSYKSNLTLSPPAALGRQNSLRAKLSLPNLRRNVDKQAELTLQPTSPTAEGDLLQVQHLDFELIRPTFGNLQDGRSSEDSGVMGRDASVDARLDKSFLRTDSPALSLTAPRSPTYLSDASSSTWRGSKLSGRGGTDSETSTTSMMEAHRNRETKWMAVVGSIQPSQSRKSKKVKKLIFDGVPSSVRYLVWSMLTDGKARIVPGVYGQLGSRAKVAALVDIERDVQHCFVDRPQLQKTQGPVNLLLQAYLTMVPDVQYTTGLTLIAGNLLLHAPEEDAFWIFVSLMDLHLRPYYSSTSAQIDVDATLFGRSMDNIDPSTAKKLFGELKISPLSICRPWFTSLFVGYLPSDYLNRVWDIFLFEGVPFLFRVALVLVSCSRQRIFDTTSVDGALSAVLHPSPELLPTSPQALIMLALAVKLKDDDLRKQRVKLEAQAKRQTLAPRTVSTPGSISLPRA
ncbi:hypothetical protein C0992_002770 [Termitomyces sp. T32_za158]|nr:hypothetical protein C0992_002770 [Termitomyces sp. T32_za158]